MIDLRPYVAGTQKQQRSFDLAGIMLGIFWIVLWLTLIQHPQPRWPSLNGALFLTVGIGIGVFFMLTGPLRARVSGTPISLRLDSTGVSFEYERRSPRRFLWTNASDWFQLVDLRGYFALPEPPLLDRPIGTPASPYYLTASGKSGWTMAYLPEDAVGQILTLAKEAGLNIQNYVSRGGRHRPPPGATIFYVKK